MSFYEDVRAQYLSLAAAEPDRFVVVDASQSLEDVQRQISTEIGVMLSSKSLR